MVLAFILLPLLVPAAAQRTPEAAAISCSPTASDDRLPGVVAPMTGQYPVWLVDGSGGAWQGAETRVKSLWVVARETEGRLRVQGRRLDAPGVMRFVTSADSDGSDTLIVADPAARSVVPAGAAPEVMQQYAFVPIYLRYPSPGCWELRAQLGDETVRIVQLIR